MKTFTNLAHWASKCASLGTNNRNRYYLFSIIMLLTFGIGNVWGATYFEDNFSNVGNKDNQSISTRTGWETFEKCYSQGNSGLRVGSKSAAGNITKSKITDISGTKDIKVTVYVARYNDNANKFTVTTTNGTINSVSGVGTLSNGTLTISPTGNAGVLNTTSTATWTDTYKTEFVITGASSATTIKFASNKRVILGPITIEDASSTDEPGSTETVVSLTASLPSLDFGSVANESSNEKSLTVSGQNLTEDVTLSIDGTDKAFFSVDPTTITKADEISQEVVVTYNPATEGSHTGTLIIKSGEITQNVTLSGKSFVLTGAGTEENPYTTTDIITLGLNDKTQAWVEGYIVGVMEDNKFATSTTKTSTNIVLADAADATEDYVPVALPSGNIRTALNLKDNSSNLGKKVAVYGTLETYFSLPGVKEVSAYKWIVEEGELAAPTITPAGGTYYAAQNVTISAEEGTTIYYTLDGTSPTTGSNEYSTPISIAETATLKAIAVKGEKTSPVASENYTINLPLTTMDQIFAKANAVDGTATSVQVVMDNWVITGVKGSNAYLTDGTKGLIIYTTSHGFEVGDVLSGTVECKVQLFNGSSELKELTSATTGLTVTKGGTVDPVVLDADGIAALEGVNTGSVIKINGVATSKDVVAGVKLYNTLFSFTDLTVGQEYNVTGVYLQYNTTPEILPRSAEDIEEVIGLPTATISIENITLVEGDEHTIVATITPDAAQTKVQYTITAGSEYIDLDGTTITAVAAGTATITATIAESAGVYYGATKEFTVTVTPLNIAALPFTFDGKKADIANTLGMSQEGIDDDDYTSSPHLKFKPTGAYLIIHFDSEPDILSYDIKGNSFSGGTFSVQESADGETYTTIATYTELGGTTSEEKELSSYTRYVKFIYTTKVNGNVALGNISITKPDTRAEAGIAWNPATVSLTVGDAFTAPTLSNPNGLTLTCTSDNDALATVTNAGVITLKEGVTGKAVITASYAGNETYKTAEVTTTIFVNPKSDDVVILAKYNGQWYAMKAEYTTGKTDRLAALPVNYVDGKLYNVSEEDKAAITWKLSVNGGNATFQNGTNYLTGGTSTTLSLSETAFDWAFDGSLYLSDSDSRTFIYHKDGYFRNYAKGNPENYPDTYSTLPTVTVPVYATGDAYGRTVTVGDYGTICIPFGSNVGDYTGAEFYEISWMEMDGATPKGIWLDQVNGALTAGKPYIFKATATELAVIGNGTTAGSPVTGVAGLTGTFTLIQDIATSDPSNTLEGNYMISGNQFLLCPAGCWLNANRAYIDATIIAGHTTKKAEIPGRRRVCLGETSENEATGFENIVAPEGQAVKAIVNGQLIIIRDGVKYNVQGQKL